MNQSDMLDPISIDLDPFVLNTKETIERIRLLWELFRNREDPFNWSSKFLLKIQDDNKRELLCELLKCKGSQITESLEFSNPKIKQLSKQLERLYREDDELFHYQEGYKKSINKIKIDPNLLVSNTPELLKYEQQLKEIEEMRRRTGKEIKKKSDLIRKIRDNG